VRVSEGVSEGVAGSWKKADQGAPARGGRKQQKQRLHASLHHPITHHPSPICTPSPHHGHPLSLSHTYTHIIYTAVYYINYTHTHTHTHINRQLLSLTWAAAAATRDRDRDRDSDSESGRGITHSCSLAEPDSFIGLSSPPLLQSTSPVTDELLTTSLFGFLSFEFDSVRFDSGTVTDAGRESSVQHVEPPAPSGPERTLHPEPLRCPADTKSLSRICLPQETVEVRNCATDSSPCLISI
jgi:hypothetical protein